MDAYIEKEMGEILEAFEAFKAAYEPIDMELFNLSQEYEGNLMDESTNPTGFVDFFAS